MTSGPEYPAAYAFLQLVQKKLPGNPDYARLVTLLTLLHTYITVTHANSLELNVVRDEFIAVMEEEDRMKAVINVDKPLNKANRAFQTEIVTLAALLKLRDEEAEARAEAEEEKKNQNRWLATAVGGALLTVGSVVVGPALAVGVLNVIGFSSVGPVAGSLAAAIQSSAAMGGIAVGSPAEIAAGIAALAAGAGFFGGGDEDDEDDNAGDGPLLT
ncbi:hypothetical protein FS837_003295 [Tulasnella sp. UAMH 9824]|nr:hypothetical protein FS837_003295 [Tulasnella sp. UAMH 9824]